jgi:hypothetical protein
MRGIRSVALPAANGTTTRIDFVGQSAACAGPINGQAAAAATEPAPAS